MIRSYHRKRLCIKILRKPTLASRTPEPIDQSYPTHHSDHTTLHPMQPQFICISSCNFKSEGLEQWKTLCLTFHKKKFSIKDFFNKCDQIHSFLQIWSHLLNRFLMENFIFLCSVRQDKRLSFANPRLNLHLKQISSA